MSAAVLPLEALGPRIVILGASNAGKSTLADAIARKSGHLPVYLDQLRFEPGSDWVERPVTEFTSDHDAAIRGERWVMDGNYSFALPRRFERATGVIVLWDRRWPAFFRYVRRTLFERLRIGTIEGDRDSLKWLMIHWILIAQPARRRMYERLAADSGLPLVSAFGMREVGALYKAWGLERLKRQTAN
jgi:adenylate kinase family enzyme